MRLQPYGEKPVQFYGAFDDVQPEGERGWRSGLSHGREPLFIGAAVLSSSPALPRQAVKGALSELHKTWPDRASLGRLQHLHFRDQKPEEQLAVLKSFARHIAAQRNPYACLLVAAVLPISVFAPDARKEAIYIEGTGWLLKSIASLLPQHAELDMTLDEAVGGNREKQKRLLSSLTNLARPGWTTGTLNLRFSHKENERLIQMADYLAGAVLQRRLRNNPAPWSCIAQYVRELPETPLAVGALKRRT